MIPVQLTIEGLYSYQHRQTIHFNDLIDAGLFGIFGAVGSGKSSILEAITFALYGETERLNSKEKRSYNMMNLKSNVSYIEFDFVNFEEKLFRITREFKRNSKRFEDIKTPTVVFYERKEEEWIPLAHQNAEQIIGLSYSNFKRTIIIPQGQFKEFIELKATARTEMMQEIFNLHKYDLANNVGKLTKDNTAELHKIEGKLQGFEAVSLEHIEAHQQQLNVEEEKYAIVVENYNTVNEAFQRLKALKTDFESLTLKKHQFEQVNLQKEEKDQQQVQLDQYELIYQAFHQLFIDQAKLAKAIQADELSLEEQKKQRVLIEQRIQEVTLHIQAIQSHYEALPHKKVEENDLDLIIQNLTFSEEIKALKARTLKGIAKVEEVQQSQKEIEDQIKKTEEEVKQLTSQRIDAQILMAVDNWFVQKNAMDQSLLTQKNKIQGIVQQFEHSSQQLVDEKIDLATFETDFSTKIQTLGDQKKRLEQQRNEWVVQQKIAHFAHNLHDGESCPLCGSLEHPNVVVMDDVTVKITSITAEIAAIEQALDQTQKRFTTLQQFIYQHHLLKEQIAQENLHLQALEEQSQAHLQLFIWEGFDSTNLAHFQAKKQAALTLEHEIEQKHKAIAAQREMLEKVRVEVDKCKQLLEKLKLEEAQKASQIEQNLSHLKVLQFDSFAHLAGAEVKEQLEALKAFNLKIEKDYHQFQLALNELNPQLAAQNSSIQLLTKQVETQQVELNQVALSIQTALVQVNLENLEAVHAILKQSMDIPHIRQQLEEFRIQYETLKNAIVELETKLANVSFDADAFDVQEQQFNLAAAQLKEANELVIHRRTEIARLTKAYEDKKEILDVQRKLQKRAELLKLFSNLFKGAGFVQYVSSIYLKQLCENANVRFHRMTRNQLSLQMNENHDFEIIDYLNEGRPRSVKTLSGGQAFQVSLSLALALAESVQSNLKASKNFFFIDEGFGTQDADAVNIVFETLNHLHKENRIVGIISHVEELKERIPMALNIVKDEEKGSQIHIV